MGVIFCPQEHGNPTGTDLYPVRESPSDWIERQLHTFSRSFPRSRRENGAQDQVAFLKLLSWAEKTIRSIAAFTCTAKAKGQISGEFAVMHPDVVTAAISYSWGW